MSLSDFMFPQLVRVRWYRPSRKRVSVFVAAAFAEDRHDALEIGEAVSFCMIPRAREDVFVKIETLNLGRGATRKDADFAQDWTLLRKGWL